MMKNFRVLTLLVMAVLAFSTLTPTAAYASPAGPGGGTVAEFGKSKEVALTVDNKTGGVMILMIAGPQSYTFYIMEQGKKVLTGIVPGKYRVVIRSSACAGTVIYSKNIMGRTSLKPVSCKNYEGTLWLSGRR